MPYPIRRIPGRDHCGSYYPQHIGPRQASASYIQADHPRHALLPIVYCHPPHKQLIRNKSRGALMGHPTKNKEEVAGCRVSPVPCLGEEVRRKERVAPPLRGILLLLLEELVGAAECVGLGKPGASITAPSCASFHHLREQLVGVGGEPIGEDLAGWVLSSPAGHEEDPVVLLIGGRHGWGRGRRRRRRRRSRIRVRGVGELRRRLRRRVRGSGHCGPSSAAGAGAAREGGVGIVVGKLKRKGGRERQPCLKKKKAQRTCCVDDEAGQPE
nr:unnamed protein product [Digitaria exilis]